MPGTPRAWQETARGGGIFRVPMLTGVAPGSADPGVQSEETPEAMRRRLHVERERERIMEEEEEEREVRRAKRQADIARANAEIERAHGGGGQGNVEMMGLIREMMDSGRRDREALQSDLAAARADAARASEGATQAQLHALEARLNSVGNATSGPPTNALHDLVTQAKALVDVRAALDNIVPAAPPVNVALSREQALQQQAVSHEVRLRDRELDARIAEAEATAQAAREERSMGAARLDRVLGVVDRAAGPLLESLVGDRFGGGGGAAPPPPEPMTAGPPGAASPQLPYTCPYCQGVNYEGPGTASTTCPRCGQFVLLTAQ